MFEEWNFTVPDTNKRRAQHLEIRTRRVQSESMNQTLQHIVRVRVQRRTSTPRGTMTGGSVSSITRCSGWETLDRRPGKMVMERQAVQPVPGEGGVQDCLRFSERHSGSTRELRRGGSSHYQQPYIIIYRLRQAYPLLSPVLCSSQGLQ